MWSFRLVVVALQLLKVFLPAWNVFLCCGTLIYSVNSFINFFLIINETYFSYSQNEPFILVKFTFPANEISWMLGGGRIQSADLAFAFLCKTLPKPCMHKYSNKEMACNLMKTQLKQVLQWLLNFFKFSDLKWACLCSCRNLKCL